jgi:hypothetical protein
MNNELLDSIRAANREFQEFIKIASPKGGNGQKFETAIPLLSRVHFRLKHISKCLATNSKSYHESPESADEVEQYRKNLRALQETIEAIQTSVLSERIRLNSARTNVQAARAWAESVRACT